MYLNMYMYIYVYTPNSFPAQLIYLTALDTQRV